MHFLKGIDNRSKKCYNNANYAEVLWLRLSFLKEKHSKSSIFDSFASLPFASVYKQFGRKED